MQIDSYKSNDPNNLLFEFTTSNSLNPKEFKKALN